VRLLGTVLAVALLAACSASPAQQPAPESSSRPAPSSSAALPPVGTVRYVALGDSFTSGPFVPTTDLADGCFRSDGNYPSLLAERLDAEAFVDVSCSGAQTEHLRRPQPTVTGARVPAQLRAVTPGTTLVTVGIGGNDADLFARLTRACVSLRASDPTGSPCRTQLDRGEGLRAVVEGIGRDVEDVLVRVRERAPQARVVLVGYPRLAPESGTCPRRLPWADGDVAFGHEVQGVLNAALRGAARRAGVEFLDMHEASRGHDVCSATPYVQGARTDRTVALAFHPRPRGMRAVADRLEALLAR
jgi:lysophospholipase L1-like esterase